MVAYFNSKKYIIYLLLSFSILKKIIDIYNKDNSLSYKKIKVQIIRNIYKIVVNYIKKSKKCQYFVANPLLSMTALHLLGIEVIRSSQTFLGIDSQAILVNS